MGLNGGGMVNEKRMESYNTTFWKKGDRPWIEYREKGRNTRLPNLAGR
jgi:hypothetical protein